MKPNRHALIALPPLDSLLCHQETKKMLQLLHVIAQTLGVPADRNPKIERSKATQRKGQLNK